MTALIIVLILFILVLIFTNITQLQKSKQAIAYRDEIVNRYKDIINIDDALGKRSTELTDKENRLQLIDKVIDLNNIIAEKEKEIKENQQSILELTEDYNNKYKTLNADYIQKREIFEKLTREIKLLEENLELKSFGVYEPHYNYETSEVFRLKLDSIREEQKNMIKNEQAATCSTEWTVNGSKVEGRKSTKRFTKLVLRAFNGECDAAIAKVKWNNIKVMEERIRKSHEVLNDLGTSQSVRITTHFLDLKLQELRLTHELQEKMYEEKEEQRRIREQMREEEKAQKEIEKALKDAEAEETRYKEALEKAKRDIESAKGKEEGKLNKKIEELEKRLAEAEAQKERALSRAQLTKSGHVYIISNIGSFGENVYKIGMTRRLEPLDRVKELGDASVPFEFDVHAMIYSENAPELENKLHKVFENKRINMYNNRKEFFKVSLDEIENEVKSYNKDAMFIRIPEAKEYRETVALLNKPKEEELQEQEILVMFPEALI